MVGICQREANVRSQAIDRFPCPSTNIVVELPEVQKSVVW